MSPRSAGATATATSTEGPRPLPAGPLARRPGLGQCRTPQRPLRPGHGPAGRAQGPAAGRDRRWPALVAQVRDRAASRLWRTLADALKPRQAARAGDLAGRRRGVPGSRPWSGSACARPGSASPAWSRPCSDSRRSVPWASADIDLSRRAAGAGPGPGPVCRRGPGAGHRPDAAAAPSRDPLAFATGLRGHRARRRPGPARPVDHRRCSPASSAPASSARLRTLKDLDARRAAAPRGVPRPARPGAVADRACASTVFARVPGPARRRPWPWSRPGRARRRPLLRGPADPLQPGPSLPARPAPDASSIRGDRRGPAGRPRRSASSRPSRARSGPT